MVDQPWEQIDSERTRCTMCRREFSIGAGDSPCSCSSPASADTQARTSETPSPGGGSAEAAATDPGDAAFWRKRLRAHNAAFTKMLKSVRALETDESLNPWFTNQKDQIRLELEVLDRQRKNTWSGYQASLSEKSDAELAKLKQLVERAEAVDRRSRAH